MKKYIALLRGINVGGTKTVSMAELKAALLSAGFKDVSTYINSGNIVFTSDSNDERQLGVYIQECIKKTFSFDVPTVVIGQDQLREIVEHVPKEWGGNDEWKYNLIFLIPPYDTETVVAAIGELKPDIEKIVVGKGVLYQSMSRKLFGRTTTGKLASNPVYQRMTIRTIGTARKLLLLIEDK